MMRTILLILLTAGLGHAENSAAEVLALEKKIENAVVRGPTVSPAGVDPSSVVGAASAGK